jgi:Uma2 family endonuclease
MATLAIVPVEEYLRTTYEPDMEYVDGQLVERHVGEYFHSRTQLLIGQVLGAREQERGFSAFTEQRVQVSDEPRYRIPDLCVKALPHVVTPVLVKPDLAIEIVSPDDTVSDMLTKIDEYLAAGIPHIWVIDPYKRTVFEAGREGIRRRPSGILETELVGAVDFNALFARLDQRRA